MREALLILPTFVLTLGISETSPHAGLDDFFRCSTTLLPVDTIVVFGTGNLLDVMLALSTNHLSPTLRTAVRSYPRHPDNSTSILSVL
jgi:hypothetical protein